MEDIQEVIIESKVYEAFCKDKPGDFQDAVDSLFCYLKLDDNFKVDFFEERIRFNISHNNGISFYIEFTNFQKRITQTFIGWWGNEEMSYFLEKHDCLRLRLKGNLGYLALPLKNLLFFLSKL